MSVRIGEALDAGSRVLAYVAASVGGVELSHTEANASLTEKQEGKLGVLSEKELQRRIEALDE